MDDFADRDADGEARSPLELDHLGAAAAVRVRIASATLEFQPGNFSSGKPAAWAADQIGTMLSPCSPRIRAVTCVGGSSSFSAIRLRNRAVSSWVPRPITCVGGQVELANGQIGQDIDRIGDDQHDRVALEAGRADLAEDAQEELDVAIDQVEPALVGLAAQAGRDDDDVALGNRLVAGRADPLIGDQRGAVEQVEGLAAAPGRRSGRSGRSG